MSELPVLRPAAFHGLIGETVRVIERVSESAPAGLLVSGLTAFGAAVGPSRYVIADGARHAARLFAMLVGQTARARKGTSWRQTRGVVAAGDPEFVAERIYGGFGSGEAVIDAVGELVEDEAKEGDQPRQPPPPRDPRALVIEEEIARILRVAERDGSTLSPILRQAWDDGDLAVLTRKRPIRARGAHICCLGHITEEELRARLSSLEAANGFANRFLIISVARSKRLPNGQGLAKEESDRLGYAWRRALARARDQAGSRQSQRLQRSRDAETLWSDWYLSLDDTRTGMIGGLLARAEAQVLRLSLIYALADGESVIDVPHLQAALEVWRYAEASVLKIFGDALGNPVADLILKRLRENPWGLTRTAIRDLLGKHEREVTIEAALDLLVSRNFAYCEQEETGGRPAERWFGRSSSAESYESPAPDFVLGRDKSDQSDQSPLRSHRSLLSQEGEG